MKVFDRLCRQHGIGDDLVLRVPLQEAAGRKLDTWNRIEMAGALLRDMVNGGL